MREKHANWRRIPERPVSGWSGDFTALYPDGETSHFSLNGLELRPGGELTFEWVLDHWEETVNTDENDKRGLVGVLRSATGDDGTDKIEQVELLFQQRNYAFGIDDHTEDGQGFEAWFAPRVQEGAFDHSEWGATRLAAALAAWDAYRERAEGANAPAVT